MANKNWTGNEQSTFSTLGASSHSKDERQTHDYYATDPYAVDILFEDELFNPSIDKSTGISIWKNIWECACGEGHLSKRMKDLFRVDVYSSDIVDRGYGDVKDFLCPTNQKWDGCIITNPPYKYAKEFVQKSLDIIPDGKWVAMFLKLQFLEGKARKQLFRVAPPRFIYVSSSRIKCGKNGDFYAIKSSAVAYAWFIWQKGFKGNPQIKWFN
tara:strand:- start:4409 stop:5044 length:636 start_codon:yes stop_codon:yes gene_type:complete